MKEQTQVPLSQARYIFDTQHIDVAQGKAMHSTRVLVWLIAFVFFVIGMVTLLPRLISGHLRLPNAKALVKEACS